ncbi:MAG: transposase [Planctomycetes bacterium]|nr:transposase [Planctomycetota bacterium]
MMRQYSERDKENACYAWLVGLLHPQGLLCPRCGAGKNLGIHRRTRVPVLDYQCARCRRVFNAWTGTPLEKTRRRPSQVVQLLRGMMANKSTSQLARELRCQRAQLATLRRKLHPLFKLLTLGTRSFEATF